MLELPEKLRFLVETMASVQNQNERVQMLLDFAERFKEVPEQVAQRPFPEQNRVAFCESEAYVWAEEQPDGTAKFYFAVENPAGVSAKALAYILDRTLSGVPLDQVLRVSPDIVMAIFRQNISMGKGMGLMAMVQTVQKLASDMIRNKHQ
ncbi:MAG TPA: SufE family protein [Acidobacteriota bacterium]|nr:SufE family protein [Acidobacteriota bacterium]